MKSGKIVLYAFNLFQFGFSRIFYFHFIQNWSLDLYYGCKLFCSRPFYAKNPQRKENMRREGAILLIRDAIWK